MMQNTDRKITKSDLVFGDKILSKYKKRIKSNFLLKNKRNFKPITFLKNFVTFEFLKPILYNWNNKKKTIQDFTQLEMQHKKVNGKIDTPEYSTLSEMQHKKVNGKIDTPEYSTLSEMQHKKERIFGPDVSDSVSIVEPSTISRVLPMGRTVSTPVIIHTGSFAEKIIEKYRADAMTVGNHIFFFERQI